MNRRAFMKGSLALAGAALIFPKSLIPTKEIPFESGAWEITGVNPAGLRDGDIITFSGDQDKYTVVKNGTFIRGLGRDIEIIAH